jgi:dethiobiotin synthetase/adenosylmethionine--8-amino-7-oxononanoate aminotransferase
MLDWASRVYFSDNGSTAIEIALKMAFRKYACDHGIIVDSEKDIRSEGSVHFKVCSGYIEYPCQSTLFFQLY